MTDDTTTRTLADDDIVTVRGERSFESRLSQDTDTADTDTDTDSPDQDTTDATEDQDAKDVTDQAGGTGTDTDAADSDSDDVDSEDADSTDQ